MKFIKVIDGKKVIIEEADINHLSIWLREGFAEYKEVELKKK